MTASVQVETLPHALTAVSNDFLVGTKGAALRKVGHALVQHIAVGTPETQGFAFGLKPVFATKFQGSPILVEGHGFAPLSTVFCRTGRQP